MSHTIFNSLPVLLSCLLGAAGLSVPDTDTNVVVSGDQDKGAISQPMPYACPMQMCAGSDGGSVRIGQLLAFSSLRNRQFAVTQHAYVQASSRGIDLRLLARNGVVQSQRNGYIYIKYGRFIGVLSHRNGTIVSAIIN
ncbi:hypothetical protein [Arcanobacterium bovis]|uniref:MSHA biogenesis protein MshK n=1 Tax=Arcanobacterium bovis TaxID=2529275 RepID=A0A4Q9V280_9ACTO|nr:hypothetical protein [Arcanobacterium bovis]TBW22241.1 hypothetical protein EZJ44_05330 [Arcanobacterium bovis]